MTIQDIWCLPPDRPLPPAFMLIGHASTTAPPPVISTLVVPLPNVLAATASVDAEQMLTPPGSAVALQDSDRGASDGAVARSKDGANDDSTATRTTSALLRT